jgi:hypothetical protein
MACANIIRHQCPLCRLNTRYIKLFIDVSNIKTAHAAQLYEAENTARTATEEATCLEHQVSKLKTQLELRERYVNMLIGFV